MFRAYGDSKRKRVSQGKAGSVLELASSSDDEEEVNSAKKPKPNVKKESLDVKKDYSEQDNFGVRRHAFSNLVLE